MPTPCIEGTYIERMNAAIVFSETKRVRVAQLNAEIGDQARNELIELYRQKRVDPPTKSMLDTVAEAAIEKDARWKNAVGDEQWGSRLTTMYALAELALTAREHTQVLDLILKKQHEATDLQRQLLAEQRTTNELLKMLVGQLSVPTERPNPPAPSQRPGD